MTDAEVIVAGGGPAGAATATWLANEGIHVLVLDRAAFPRDKACAEFLSPGAVAALEQLGVLEDAEPLERRDGARREELGAGLVPGEGGPVEHEHVPALAREQRRRRRTGGPAAHDDHLSIHHGRTAAIATR